MKITVVYNRGLPLALEDEDTIKTAQAIVGTLGGELFDLNELTAQQLKKLDTDFFFNAAFGIGNVSRSEAEVADLLERTGKPYSGSDAKAIVLTTDKTATKQLLSTVSILVPGNKKFPLIVKPNNEDSSLGICETSVVDNKRDLDARVKFLKKTYLEPVLVEEYIDGRELNVTVLGNGKTAQVLPISEIIFGPSFARRNKIVDFAAKWEEETTQYHETVGVCPAKLKEEIKKKIEEISLKAFKITGCRDYARVDIRLGNDNMPYVLEVNANPAIGPSDGATRSAKAAGYSYKQFLEKIIDVAIDRFQNQRPN